MDQYSRRSDDSPSTDLKVRGTESIIQLELLGSEGRSFPKEIAHPSKSVHQSKAKRKHKVFDKTVLKSEGMGARWCSICFQVPIKSYTGGASFPVGRGPGRSPDPLASSPSLSAELPPL